MQAALIASQDCAKDAEGAIRDEIIDNATTEANPTFLIASLLDKPVNLNCTFIAHSSLVESGRNPSIIP